MLKRSTFWLPVCYLFMPHYFFHVHDTIDLLDDEGDECSSVEAALVYAILTARELAADEARSGVINLNHRIEITDAAGAVVDVVLFRDAVRVLA